MLQQLPASVALREIHVKFHLSVGVVNAALTICRLISCIAMRYVVAI